MSIDRDLWKESVTRFRMPRWPCPRCRGGHFVLNQESIHWLPTSEGYAFLDEYPEGRGDDVSLRFSALAECDNRACRETTSMSGNGLEKRAEDGDGGLYCEFFPSHVSPSPDLFHIPKRVPAELRNQIRRHSSDSWLFRFQLESDTSLRRDDFG